MSLKHSISFNMTQEVRSTGKLPWLRKKEKATGNGECWSLYTSTNSSRPQIWIVGWTSTPLGSPYWTDLPTTPEWPCTADPWIWEKISGSKRPASFWSWWLWFKLINWPLHKNVSRKAPLHYVLCIDFWTTNSAVFQNFFKARLRFQEITGASLCKWRDAWEIYKEGQEYSKGGECPLCPIPPPPVHPILIICLQYLRLDTCFLSNTIETEPQWYGAMCICTYNILHWCAKADPYT